MGKDLLVTILALLALIIGAYIIWIGFVKGGKNSDEQESHGQKDGQPILPRSERQFDDIQTPEITTSEINITIQDDADALGSLAAVASSHSNQSQNTHTKDTQAPTTAKPISPPKKTKESQEIQEAPSQNKQPKPNQTDIVAHQHFENQLDQPFNESSPTLNQHFRTQASERDNDVLLNHKDTITIIITPRNSFSGIDGSTILKLAKDYAMKYGILKMFHRYETPEGTGQLWFSMVGVSHEGISGFDLVALPDLNYRALAMFLSLPHPQALKGFDSMVAVAQAIAAELDADIHDEDNFILDQSHFQAMRNLVASYQ